MVDFPVALEHAQAWMDEVQGVEAVGECELKGKKCISVYISLPEAAAKLPSKFEGCYGWLSSRGTVSGSGGRRER